MPPVATTVAPARQVRGRLRVPGDKSISHRYALIASLSEGLSVVTGYASGEDCRSTIECLRALGISITETNGRLAVEGRGWTGFRPPAATLDAGNSGSTMRMMAGVLAAQPFTTLMSGDRSLSRRPMRRVIDPLVEMGGEIEAVDGHAPLTIRGKALHGIVYRPPVPSAQVKSAVLFAGLQASGVTSVKEPAQTRDHTERALKAFGFEVQTTDGVTAVIGGQKGHGREVSVPGDFSSAAFWMVAAASLPGSRVEIEDVGLNPTRTHLLQVLGRFGARVEVHETASDAGEPRGHIVIEGHTTGSLVIAPEEVPALIDELPALAALAAQSGQVSVSGASELRVKESDRIADLVAGFRSLGIDADERTDGFTIRGGGAPAGGVADARGDHRLAMAFAVAALSARAPSRIEGADAVAVSYPDFFATLDRLVA